jgi:hypothetical protein
VQTVYPNANEWYFNNPFYFSLTSNTTLIKGAVQPTINVEVVNFFGIAVSSRVLNGLWMDFIIVVIFYWYLNNFGLWLLNKPFKIVMSEKTRLLVSQVNPHADERILATQLRSELPQFRFYKVLKTQTFTNFQILLILVFILTTIAAHTVISLGYFIFAMLLSIVAIDLFKKP